MNDDGVHPSRSGASRRTPRHLAGVPTSGRGGGAAEPNVDELAQALLDAMAAIRRTARRVAGGPPALTTLTASQHELVRIVRRRPGISVADAAEELRLAPNTVSTLVGRLIEAGVIARTPDRDDRRVARLSLDPQGSQSVVAWHDRSAEAVASALARIPADGRRRLRGAQEVLVAVAVLLEEDATAAEQASNRRHGRGRTSPRAGADVAAER